MPTLSHPRFKRCRASLRALAVGSLMAASALVLAPGASAGEYRVFTCGDALGRATSGVDWRAENHGDAPPSANQCGSNGLMYATLAGGQRHTTAWAGFGLRMPEGLLVKRIDTRRWVMLMPGPDQYASVRYDLLVGTADKPWDWTAARPDTCVLSEGCAGWGWDGRPGGTFAWEFPNGASFLGFAVSCRGDDHGACGNGENGRAHLRVNSADLVVQDMSPPQVLSGSGTLLQSGARSGKESLAFGATDVGAGVFEAIVRLDGKEIAKTRPDSSPSCADLGSLAYTDLEFDRVQPCSRSVAAAFSIDTTKLADGAHDLVAVVRDAAGNFSGPIQQRIVIDNVPAPTVSIKPTITGAALATGLRPGDAVAAQNGIWGGPTPTFTQRWQRSTPAGTWIDIPNATGGTYRVGNDDVDRQLRVVVAATSSEGVTEVASEATGVVKSGKSVVVQSVQPSGQPGANGSGEGNGSGGNPATGQLVVDREQRTVDVKHGAKIVITGRLVDADGNPIANAVVDVFEQIAVTAAAWNKVDTVKTDSQGGYVYRPKTTASRRLRFAYSDKGATADYRATREVFVSVTAAMTIKAEKRVVPRRGLIRITGQVLVDQLPDRGAWVEVQVLDAGVWRTVATRRVDQNGRWAFKHRLRAASATRFAFRARLRAAGDLATAEAKSTPVKVRVR